MGKKKNGAALEKNAVYEAEVTGYTAEGAGVVRADGVPVFVPGAAQGDVLRVRVVKPLSTYAFGRQSDFVERTCCRYSRGFKRGLPLSLEVKEPGGSLCAHCETFFTQESFRRCGLRKPTKGLEESSEKEQRSFSCPHR